MKEILDNIWKIINEYEIVLTTISLFITIWTFLQVSSLKKAQVQYDELVETDNLINMLSRISDYFTSNIAHTDIEIYRLQQEIQRSIGKIEGVKTALFNKKKKAIKSNSSMPEFISEGYYSDPFLAERISETKLKLCVFAKRNQRISNMDHLQSIAKLLAKSKNCIVELMAISPDVSDEILVELNKTIPIAAPNIQKLREEIIENRRRIVEFKNTLEQSQKERFHYYEYWGAPPFHCILVDDYLYFGLVNYHKSPDEYRVVENRPCIKLDTKSTDFAQRIKKQYESFVNECKQEGREF